VLLKLTILRKKVGGTPPPEIKVGEARPMRPPGSDTYGGNTVPHENLYILKINLQEMLEITEI